MNLLLRFFSAMGSSSAKLKNSSSHLYTNPPFFSRKGIVVIGYLRQTLNSKKEYKDLSLPTDITSVCIKYYGALHGSLVVDQFATYICKDISYEYDSITLHEGSTLTCLGWNSKHKSGGILHIVCYGDIILNTARITLDGKGYKGGEAGKNGESYSGKSKYAESNNYGGGGGTGRFNKKHVKAANASYGGKGTLGAASPTHRFTGFANVGECYGDKELSVLYRGSGGGGYYPDTINDHTRLKLGRHGGNGGGALKLECYGRIIFNGISSISCNGMEGAVNAGNGSGGSIHIVVMNGDRIEMNERSVICAKGGNDKGGVGRIRIEYATGYKESCQDLTIYSIVPTPFIG